jgi:hypothetical protein
MSAPFRSLLWAYQAVPYFVAALMICAVYAARRASNSPSS